MASIFSRIILGEMPCYKIAEDDRYFAFLDINPMAIGHILVIPKKEVDYIFDLSEDDLSGLFLFAKKIAAKMDSVLECKRVGVMVVGLEVPHAHIHLIPIVRESDMNLSNKKLKLSPEEFKEIQNKIQI